MQGIIYFAKRSAWILVLAALLSGALVQAQKLEAPSIIKEWTAWNWRYPDLLEIMWSQVEGEASAEIWIKGPGKWKPKRQGGWFTVGYPAVVEGGYHIHQFRGLMPGNTYTFRVRAVDENGKKGKASKPFKWRTTPCWVFNRFWETGDETHHDRHGPMPDEWAIKNTVNCEGVNFLPPDEWPNDPEEEPEDEG